MLWVLSKVVGGVMAGFLFVHYIRYCTPTLKFCDNNMKKKIE